MSSSDLNPTESLETAPSQRVDLNTQQRDRVAGALREHPFPTEIGRYRILSVLGHGGMGSVYEAEQDKPHRRVALKVIRPGLLTPAMARRFEYETEVLARLDHPGIAKIFDAGTADVGLGPQPYFAMELVQAKRLDEYVRDTHLSTEQRLKLLIEICNAVHHAHTKGVIHRDLKPSNILVTSEGQPKILDFGVARAIDSDIHATTLHTESGQLVGTLPYMAPEQAAGKVSELDTSSDVYALGVIAYELLSGTMPYSLEGKALHEAVRVICEQEPSRLSSINRSLKGDVETIVQKALDKDKTRRYHTAGELAGDVKRYLDYEPITARPPGTWYQLSKFAKRNKVLVGAFSVVMLVLVGAAVTSTWFAMRAQWQKRQAQAANDSTAAVNEFLKEMLWSASPYEAQGKPALVEDVLNRAASRVDESFKSRPLVAAALHNTIGGTYQALGRYDLALPHALASIELHRHQHGVNHADTIASMVNAGMILASLDRRSEAERMFRDTLDASRSLFGDDDWKTIHVQTQLAETLDREGRSGEAEPLVRDAFARSLRVLDENHEGIVMSANILSRVLMSLGNFQEACRLSEQAVQRSRRTLGDDHPGTLHCMFQLASALVQSGQGQEALGYYREVASRSERVFGPDHPDTIATLTTLGDCLSNLGQYAESEAMLQGALERYRRKLGGDHAYTLTCSSNLGLVLNKLGRHSEAELLLRDALERRRRVMGVDHPDSIGSGNNLAFLLRSMGRLSEAEDLYRDALDRSRRVLTAEHVDTINVMHNLASLLIQLDRAEPAERLFREAREIGSRIAGAGHPNTVQATYGIGIALMRQKRPQEALAYFKEAYEKSGEMQIDPTLVATYMSWYGPCLVELKQFDEARAPLQEAQRRLHAAGMEQHPRMRGVLRGLVTACDQTGDIEEAAQWRSRLESLEAATRPAASPATAPATSPSR